MNQLPPLPLIDGALFIDNSTLEKLTTCPRSLEYSFLHKRISAADKPSLNFGSAIHLALEYRYRVYKNRVPDAELENAQADILSKYFEENPQPMDDWRNLNWAVETVKRYNERYKFEEFNLLQYKEPRKCDKCLGSGVANSRALDELTSMENCRCPWCSGTGKTDIMVELSFALPLCKIHKLTLKVEPWDGRKESLGDDYYGVCYTGKIDLPVLLDDQLFILDHKTTSMVGSSFFDTHKKAAQFRGYCWAMEEVTKQKVSGFIINAVRTKEPIVKNAKESDNTYAGRLAKWWDESLPRERYYLPDGWKEEWIKNTKSLIGELFHYYQEGYFPMKTAWCCGKYGKCQYFDVCDLKESDRALYLDSGMFQDNTWSPLKDVVKQTT